MGFGSGAGFASSRQEDEETLSIRSDSGATVAVLPSDYCIIITAANTQAVTVNLEAAATAGKGRILQIKSSTNRSGEADITINPDGSETIDGSSSATGFDGVLVGLTIICDGTTWWKI